MLLHPEVPSEPANPRTAHCNNLTRRMREEQGPGACPIGHVDDHRLDYGQKYTWEKRKSENALTRAMEKV